MKKLTGWLIIVVCSLFLLIFAFALVLLIPGLISSNSTIQSQVSDIIRSLFGMGFAMFLFVLGLRYGIKNVRKPRKIETVEYPDVLLIHLSGEIGYKDYRNLILGLTFKKPVYLAISGILILNLLAIITNKQSYSNYFDPNYFLCIIFGIFFLSPLFTINRIKKIYKTNKIFHEKLDYTITNESIQIKGESVDSTQKWTHFFKIKETKSFFMLYQGTMVATLLDKKMFNVSDLEEFRRFLKSIHVVQE